MYRWFIGFRGHSCADVASDVHVPYRAMEDLGLCAFVADFREGRAVPGGRNPRLRA